MSAPQITPKPWCGSEIGWLRPLQTTPPTCGRRGALTNFTLAEFRNLPQPSPKRGREGTLKVQQTNVKNGVLAGCAILLLIGCATQPPPRAILIDVPLPVLQRIPEERLRPLEIDHEYPDGYIFGPDVERRLLVCEATVARANIDRAWIRERQDEARGLE